jgi:neutral ceramidase
VVEDVNASVAAGPGGVARAVFWAANPRADLKHGGTFLEVQRQNASTGLWDAVVATDADFSTKFHYTRVDAKGFVGKAHEAQATIEWAVPADATLGSHRLKYFGDATGRFTHQATPFEGTSGTFKVVAA